jgi:hypothetical protein
MWLRTAVATRYKDRQTDRSVIVKLVLQALVFSLWIVHERYTIKRHLFVALSKFPTVGSNNMVDARYFVMEVTSVTCQTFCVPTVLCFLSCYMFGPSGPSYLSRRRNYSYVMRVLGCLMFVMAHRLNLNSVSGINLEERVFCDVKILYKYNCFRAVWFHILTYWAVHQNGFLFL